MNALSLLLNITPRTLPEGTTSLVGIPDGVYKIPGTTALSLTDSPFYVYASSQGSYGGILISFSFTFNEKELYSHPYDAGNSSPVSNTIQIALTPYGYTIKEVWPPINFRVIKGEESTAWKSFITANSFCPSYSRAPYRNTLIIGSFSHTNGSNTQFDINNGVFTTPAHGYTQIMIIIGPNNYIDIHYYEFYSYSYTLSSSCPTGTYYVFFI